MLIKRFEDIESWKKARELCKEVRTATRRKGPFDDDAELRWQLRDASASAMSNIAEGFESGYRAEFIRFLLIARRSAAEVQSHSYVALDAGYLDSKQFARIYGLANDVRGLIGGFLKHLGWAQQPMSGSKRT